MKINNRNFFRGKKVFITGGTGFIGTHLIRELVSMGAEIGTYVHLTNSEYEKITGSLSTELVSKLHEVLLEFMPDMVVHLAACPLINYAKEDIVTTFELNVDGTFRLLEACKGIKSIKSIVHVATDKVYGNIPQITSQSVPNGVLHPYNATKLCGDIIAQMYSNTFDMPIVVIRNGNIYGDGDLHFERIVPRTIQRVFDGKSPIIRGDGNSLRDYIFIDDIVIGFLNALEYGWERTSPTILNLGSEYPLKVIEVVDEVLKSCKRIDIIPQFESLLQNEIPNQHIYDTESATKIGWKPNISFEEGIERAIIWYRENL